jgi:RHS repeat-associated protein
MKKIFYSLVLLTSFTKIVAQNTQSTQTSATTPINIGNTIIYDATQSTTSSTSTLTAGTPTGDSQEVGVTEGELSVSLTGSASYNIPIAVPPGINGVEPKIGLSYNSNAGNGIAGYGWNISGLSAITRIPSTKYHDNNNDPVDFDALDRFALDGQRLIVKNGTTGTYGANETVYETEVFSNVKITSYGVHPNGANYGPAYFTVRYPDSSYAQYGYTTNSTSIATWAITHWVSPQNVRINFFYTLLDNNLYISSIKYGNGGTIQTLNEISFEYKLRTRREFVYVGGNTIQNKQIIEKINVIGNSVYIRNYLLEYQASSLGYDRLIKLTERYGNSLTIAYNPTVFEYEETSINNNLSSSQTSTIDQNLASSDYKYTVGDFDNDSKSDFIFYNKTNVNYNGTFILYKGLNPNISTNTGIQTISGSNGTIIDAFTTKLVYQTPSQETKFFDKDTWTTIYKPFNFNNTTQPIKFKSYQYNNISNTVELIQEKSTSISNYESSYVKFLNGDFNGDKITDIILLTKENGTTFSNLKQVRFFDLKDNTSNFLLISGSVSIFESIQQLIDVQTCDFNGDGKTDIIIIDNNGMKVYTIDFSNNSLTTLCTYSQTGLLTKPHYLGDFNGDGNTDFVVPGNAHEDNWTFYISNGLNNFVTYSKSIGLEYLDYQVYNSEYGWNPQLGIVDHIIYQYVETQFVINDFDRDGKSDILKQKRKKTHHTKNIQTNIEDYSQQGQIRENYLEYAKNYYINSAGESYFGSQFINGIDAGISDLGGLTIVTDIMKSTIYNLDFTYVQGNKIFSRTMAKNHKAETLLKSITTGNGVKETITYEPFTAESATEFGISLTASTISENYPNIDLKTIPSLMVVSKLEKQSTSSYKKRFFLYSEAVSNVDGLGFLGFRKNLITDWYDNNTSFENIILNTSFSNINLRGAIQQKSRFSFYGYLIEGISNSSIFTYNTPSEAILPNKVFKLKLNHSEELNGLNNTNIINEYTYNDNNSLTTQVTTIENGTTQEEIRFTDIDYESLFTNEATYIVDRPTMKHKYNLYNGNLIDESSSYELYTYNSSHLLSQIKTKTTNSEITTSFLTQNNTYDSYGNLTKKKITAVGMTPRETNYVYGTAYGYRFLTKSIDVDGLATEYTYNSSTGNLLTETLPSNAGFPLTTTYTYDVWGKKTNTLNFLGNNQTVEYLKQNEKTLVTTTTIVADGNSVSTELLDDLGRKIQSGAKTLNGDMSYVDYEYDNFNRPIKVSEPHFEGDTTLWNQTSYDNYGRVNQTITAAGKTTTIAYDELTTTINDGTKTKVTVKNALGNVISLTETPGGTVTYEYFANDNLKSSTADGATTTIVQDGWGRKKELHDPAAGIFKYTYNDLGEITKEENPNGFTEYTYYPTGKLHTKWVKNAAQPTTTNISSTYDYDPTTKMLSTITVENPNDGNNTFSYAYDNYRRLTGTTEEYTTIQPRTFSKNLTFDGYGRIATETVTASAFNKSTTKTTLNTYSNGFLNKIYDGTAATGTPLWQLGNQNARGQVTNELFGNSISASQTYDDYGFPVITSHSRMVNGSKVNVMQLTNTFDEPKGNLTNRTNSLFAWNEPFDYDTADRLTQYNNNQGQSITQDYFESGKIQTNNLGTYEYTVAANPYKNTSLSDLTVEGQTFANRNQAVTYNAFNSPIDITQSNERISFGYNALQQRSVMYYGNTVVDKFNRSLRKYYSADGSIEIKYTKATTTQPEKVEFFTYIGGDAYSAPLVVRKIDNGIYENFYLHRDHLGSILAITNSAGAIIEKRLFDAWGKILKIQNGSGATLTRFTFFDRGYTGHEHMQGVALINMNGRVYDPQLHRFLQPDNNIQDPFNTQNFNRYGYVLNNPLKYTDESGEFWGQVLAFLGQALISSYVHTAQATGEGNIFKWDATTWQSFGMNTASSTASYAATNYANSYIDHYNDKPKITEPNRLDGIIDSVNPVKMAEGMIQGEMSFLDSVGNIISGNGGVEDFESLSDKFSPANQMARGLAYLGIQAFEGDEYSQGMLIGQAVVILVTKKAGAPKATLIGGERAIVLGEGMGAVKSSAKALQSQGVNAKWYQAWSKNFPKNRLMTPTELDAALNRNSRWLNNKINQGYKIYDIGIDPTRGIRSPFYELEQSILRQRQYPSIIIPR